MYNIQPMHDFLVRILLAPLRVLLAQVGATPTDVGILLLTAITLVLLGGVTLYFIEHKKNTHPVDKEGGVGAHHGSSMHEGN